jgi:hypothetical protein
VYQDFRVQMDLGVYAECTEKLINKTHDYIYKLFYGSLDFNQDQRLCEWDLFKAVETIIKTQNDELI